MLSRSCVGTSAHRTPAEAIADELAYAALGEGTFVRYREQGRRMRLADLAGARGFVKLGEQALGRDCPVTLIDPGFEERQR